MTSFVATDESQRPFEALRENAPQHLRERVLPQGPTESRSRPFHRPSRFEWPDFNGHSPRPGGSSWSRRRGGRLPWPSGPPQGWEIGPKARENSPFLDGGGPTATSSLGAGRASRPRRAKGSRKPVRAGSNSASGGPDRAFAGRKGRRRPPGPPRAP